EVDPVGDGAPRIVPGERLSGGRLERPEDVALAPPAIVDLLPRSLGGSLRRVYHALAGIGLGRFRSHLIHTDHDATSWGLGVEPFNRPLFAAKSGSTRLPNHVSWVRHRSPSRCKTSWMRLRLMASPCVSWR